MSDEAENENVLDTVADNLSQLADGSIDTLNELAESIEDESVSQSFQDIARNIDEQSPEFQDAIKAYMKGNKPVALQKAYDAATDSGGNTTRAVVAGGLAGSIGGPLGSLLGAIVSGSAVFVYEMRDGRKLWAVSLDDDQIPSNPNIVESTEEPINSNSDIQYLLDQVFKSDSEWSELEQRLTRNVNFKSVSEDLDNIPYTQAEGENSYSGHYVRHNGQVIVVMFGEEIEAKT